MSGRRHKFGDAALVRRNFCLRYELAQREAQIYELKKVIANLIIERDAADAALDQLAGGEQ